MHMFFPCRKAQPGSRQESVREFAQTTFSKNHEYVFVLHTDEPHRDCHVTVKLLGFNGKRLNPRKADLQQWRARVCGKVTQQGVNAEATPALAVVLLKGGAKCYSPY